MTQLIDELAEELWPTYRLLHVFSSGGAAHVLLADDMGRRRRVAIKVLREELADSSVADRFLGEIRVAAGLNHSHIVPVFESGWVCGLPYYVMPFIVGESLRALLDRQRSLSLDCALRIAAEIASALDYTHARRVVHRDIKPENVLLDNDRALVTDFGIAFALDPEPEARRTLHGTITGTPAYMSPEQATGALEIDGRSDVYSLACVTYEMISGHTPFSGAPRAVMARQISAEPIALADQCAHVPVQISAVVSRALAKKPKDRYPTPGTFMAALRDAWTLCRENHMAVTVEARRKTGT